MARVLKITSGLMGVLLLIFIGLFSVARNRHAPPEAVIMLFNGEYVGGFLMMVIPGTDVVRPVSPTHFYIPYESIRIKENWIYYLGGTEFNRYNKLEGQTYRVYSNGNGLRQVSPSEIPLIPPTTNLLTTLNSGFIAKNSIVFEVWGWTPDGLIYSDARDERNPGFPYWRVWRFNPITGERVLINDYGEDYFAAWSPNREWLIYKQVTEWNSTLWRMHPDGTNKERIWTRPPEFSHARLPTESFVTWYIVNRDWQPLILAAISLTFILTPILMTPLRRRFHPAKV